MALRCWANATLKQRGLAVGCGHLWPKATMQRTAVADEYQTPAITCGFACSGGPVGPPSAKPRVQIPDCDRQSFERSSRPTANSNLQDLHGLRAPRHTVNLSHPGVALRLPPNLRPHALSADSEHPSLERCARAATTKNASEAELSSNFRVRRCPRSASNLRPHAPPARHGAPKT